MNKPMLVSYKYRRAVFESCILQAIIVTVGVLGLDFGLLAQICAMACVAFWGGVGVLVYRHPRTPTRFNLSFIRIGYLPVAVITAYLAPFIWHLRGVL